MRLLNIFILLSIICSSSLLAKDKYIIAPAQSEYDASHDYYKRLLQKALNITAPEYGASSIKVFNRIITQGRAENELLNNTKSITIHRMGTSIVREGRVRAIRVPLTRGMLGHRVFIIHRRNLDKFSKIKSLEELRALTACQGLHWPDSDILENAKLKVLRTPKYEAMFQMLEAGRCDFFPRAIHEANVEVKARRVSNPDLIVEPSIMLHYDFPMYFFVSKRNSSIAKRVEEGLVKLIKNKQFDQFMQSHPTTSHVFPLSQWSKRKVFKLKNPFLPRETPLNDKKLWLKIID